MSRKAAVKRKTSEVEVAIELNIDGKGIYEINERQTFTWEPAAS